MFELDSGHIKRMWPLFEKYYEKYKEAFKENGHESLIEAIRWQLAYSYAEQFQDENTRSQANSFKDGISPIPTDLNELQEEMAFYWLNYKSFITFCSYK